MDHRTARTCVALAAALMIALPAPALAHGGDTAPSPSPGAEGHDLTGHDMAGMEGHDMGAMDEDDTSHDHSDASHDGDTHQGDTHEGDTSHDHDGDTHDGDTSHDHGATTEQSDHTDHEQTEDTVSPQMRTLVLTGFGSVNGAVVVAAFLIRRQRPARQTGARR